MWLSPLFFFPRTVCDWNILPEAVVRGFPWGIQGHDSRITQFVFWYSTDNRCRQLRPCHEEPLFSFSCFLLLLLLSFVAPLVCFCCSLHSTSSITWPVYYRLGVFNILKLSRNLEEEEEEEEGEFKYFCLRRDFTRNYGRNFPRKMKVTCR